MQMLDCIVIGGGQCGLYAAHCLAAQGRDFLLLERSQPGSAWRARLASMTLFTSRQFCGLPGKPMAGDPGGFPTVDEMAAYLEQYAAPLTAHIKADTEVVKVSHNGDGFVIQTATGEQFQSRSLINATGSNQQCIMPEMANALDADVLQYSAAVREFDNLPAHGQAVVVGSGASGRQIAGLLADKGLRVTLARGTPRGLPPNTVLGKDLFWWLKRLGILFADKNSLIAKLLKKRNPVPCGEVNDQGLLKRGVELQGRAIGCEGRRVQFDNGEHVEADVVVWALGYQDATDWLQVDQAVHNGEFVHTYGTTPQPGLFVVGRKWLSCRASELVMGTQADVDRVMLALAGYLDK